MIEGRYHNQNKIAVSGSRSILLFVLIQALSVLGTDGQEEVHRKLLHDPHNYRNNDLLGTIEYHQKGIIRFEIPTKRIIDPNGYNRARPVRARQDGERGGGNGEKGKRLLSYHLRLNVKAGLQTRPAF